jgi:hypothetical protein
MARGRRSTRHVFEPRQDSSHFLPNDFSVRSKHNRRVHFRWRESDGPDGIRSGLAMFADLYRYHHSLYRRYVEEGRFSQKQLRTIYALMIEGLSEDEFGAAEGVTRQAISERVNGLANKAPEFFRWWRRLNAARQQPGRKAASDE